MSNDLHNQIRSTIRRALYSTLGIPMLALPVAMAQQATNQTAAATGGAPVKMEKTVVTGSLIPTAETVGPAPVEVVGSVEIQKSGQQDILQTLKRLSTSFAGNGNVGQTINNRDQGGGEANIAVRNLPTLVLMDGRRLANSAFSQGAVVDVNTIPISMIERIEVLKDGASTLYGSDAIGGVVNIITKKNYNGAEITGRYGFPTDKTRNDLIEYRASIVAGASTEKSSLVAGVDYYHMDPLLSADRHVASAEILDLLRIGIAPPTYVSGSFPARVNNFILAGSPFAVGAPGYNPNITTPPVDRGTTYTNLSSYMTAHPGVYIPIDSTPLGAALLSNGVSSRVLLNTTLLGTHSIQLQDRRNAFANFEHDLLEKKIQVFGSFFYANNHAEGKLAPSPVPALGPAGLNNIFIPANNPYNPFQEDLSGAAGEPRIRTRFIEVGNRIFDSDYNYYRFVGGLKGDITDRYRYEAAYTYNRSEQTQLTHGAVDGDSLNKALTPDLSANTNGTVSMLTDASGNALPTYNLFALPGFNSQATIDALRTTLFETGLSEEWGVDGHVNGTPYDLPAGSLSFAVGGEFRSESLSLDVDALQKTGNGPGLNPIQPFPPRRRDISSGFAEVLIPVFSPDYNIPGFHSFEIDASGRIEHLEPGGDAQIPKVAVRWQPIDNQVTLRSSYSESFVAPTLFNLYGPVVPDNPNVTINNPVLGNGSGQITAFYPSNPNIPPATARNYSLGIVYSPKQLPGLTLSVDYYRVVEEGIGATPDLNQVASDLNARGSGSPYANGPLGQFTFADNTRLATTAPNQVTFGNFGTIVVAPQPGASQRTDGLDLALAYAYPTDDYGKFTLQANANLLFSYYFRGNATFPSHQYAGYYTAGVLGANGTLPDYFIADSLTWEYKNFTFVASSRYIPEVKDLGTAFPTTGNTVNTRLTSTYRAANGNLWKVPAYYTVDMQLSYEFGKTKENKSWYDRTRVTVGVNNVSDNLAPFISSGSEDNTDKSTYDLLGRFVYFELAKKF